MVDAGHGLQAELRDFAEFLLARVEAEAFEFHAVFEQRGAAGAGSLVGEFLPAAGEAFARGVVPRRRVLRSDEHGAHSAAALPCLRAVAPGLDLLVDDVLQSHDRRDPVGRVGGIPAMEDEHVLGRHVDPSTAESRIHAVGGRGEHAAFLLGGHP